MTLRRLAIAGATVAAALAALGATPARSVAACGNPVACENALPGTDPATWEVDGAGDPTIQGYATSMSTNVGGTVSFKIKSATSNYRIDIYRLGWYGGSGGRPLPSKGAPTRARTPPAGPTPGGA